MDEPTACERPPIACDHPIHTPAQQPKRSMSGPAKARCTGLTERNTQWPTRRPFTHFCLALGFGLAACLAVSTAAATDAANAATSATATAAASVAAAASTAATASKPATAPASTAASATRETKTATAQRAPDAPCRDWIVRLPNVSRNLCERAAVQTSAGRSIGGRQLYTRDVQAPDSRLRVLVVAAMHGDELSSASVALHWLGMALQEPPAAMPHPVHWRFVPVLNPDGLLSRPPRRTNARGVDLNRNFPTPNWAREAPLYWHKRTGNDPRRFPGRTPLSEPESQFLHAQMMDFAPHLIVSIHAPYGVLDFDGPSVPPSRLGRLYLDQVGIFPGSLGNYGGVHKGVPVVTVELPAAHKTPSEAEMAQMWVDLLRWTAERISPEGRALGR